MVTVKEAAAAFLANKRIAVTGVSRKPQGHGSNAVYKRLRDRGYEVSPSTPTQTRSKAIGATATCATLPAASTRS